MKASVKLLNNLGIDSVEISLMEQNRITTEILNNAYTDVLINKFNDKEVSEYEALLILLFMGYFDKFVEEIKKDYVEEKFEDIKDIHTTETQANLRNRLINLLNTNSDELLKNISTIYDYNKKELLDSFGITYSNKIDTVAKELLARKLNEDLINLAQDYFRTFGRKINENINLTLDDLLKNLENLEKDIPLVNKDGMSTKNLADRVRDIARTTETAVKAQAMINTALQLGIEGYNIRTTGSNICPDCLEIEANNPYKIGSGIVPPFHNLCKCIVETLSDTFTGKTIDVDRFFDVWSKSWVNV